MRDDEHLIGQRHYDPAKSAEYTKELRARMQVCHEAYINNLAAQEAKLNVPIKIDFPIPAIRAWSYSYSARQLASLAMPNFWDGPVEREQRTPRRRGVAGFWAIKPTAEGLAILEAYYPSIVGIVELSGLVVEHEFGWRGQVCTINHLCITRRAALKKIDLEALEQRYQCPVESGSLEYCRHVLKHGAE